MIEKTLTRIASGDFFLIAGPCVIESEALVLEIAEHVAELARQHDIPYIFKASFKKANRTSGSSFTGHGIEQGLSILKTVKDRLRLPVLTDVHETTEVDQVAEVVDVLQIPAFLCRQTDLIVRAAATGKWVNIKKGQFMAPEDMAHVVTKANTDKLMLTERGTTFGYHNLVVDFRSLLIMKQHGLTVFDATHSLQKPSGAGKVSTGQPDYVIPMAKAAVAVGIDGLFVETHPDPSSALSDAGAMLPLDKMRELLTTVMHVREATQQEK
ncbi:MAG: 3-deoxy-8-phosphooctulonate synthase [candidate division Zixibacteria bacterium]|nr:3-deoxy-8-phosphooctulonate synthase [candidate division Zixibacteria bacterium]